MPLLLRLGLIPLSLTLCGCFFKLLPLAYAFVNFKDENGALRAVQTYHHERQWNTRLTVVKKDSRPVSVSDDSPISPGPRSFPAVPTQASPNAAPHMVAEGGQVRSRRPCVCSRPWHCTEYYFLDFWRKKCIYNCFISLL